MRPKAEIRVVPHRKKGGRTTYSWRCIAANGEVLATTTQRYSRWTDLKNAVELIRNAPLVTSLSDMAR